MQMNFMFPEIDVLRQSLIIPFYNFPFQTTFSPYQNPKARQSDPAMRPWIGPEVVREGHALVLLSNLCVFVCFCKLFLDESVCEIWIVTTNLIIIIVIANYEFI